MPSNRRYAIDALIFLVKANPLLKVLTVGDLTRYTLLRSDQSGGDGPGFDDTFERFASGRKPVSNVCLRLGIPAFPDPLLKVPCYDPTNSLLGNAGN